VTPPNGGSTGSVRARFDTGRAPAAQTSLRAARILIVGVNYWPEPTGIAPYTTGLAEYLATRARSVEVITGLPSYPEWSVAPEYRKGWRFAEERAGVCVCRVKHFVPARLDAVRRGMYEASFLAHACAVRVSTRPDVVLGVSPALGGAVAASAHARRHRARLVLIVQDLMGAAAVQSGITGGRAVAGLATRLERHALLGAAAVVVVTDAFRPRLRAYGVPEAKIHTVPNWARVPAPRADRQQTRAGLGWAPGTVVVLHTGNMGFKQGLENVVEAARLSRADPNVRWVLMGDGSKGQDLRRLGAGLPNLTFLPLCEAADYGSILDAADILLLNERASVEEMSLPSKLTSYFSSGRPVAAAVRGDGAAAAELTRAGAPEPVPPGDALALVRLVLELAACPDRRARHGRLARRYAQQTLQPGGALHRMESIIIGARSRPIGSD
jgi:glycosyltransferase involved in cell wall biosynthesis